MIILKTSAEIAIMQIAAKVVEEAIRMGFFAVNEALQKGDPITKLDVDRIMSDVLMYSDMKSAFYGFKGYPGNACICINDELVHGIPDATIIKNGDLLTLDFGAIYQGWNADAAVTRLVGKYDTLLPKYKEAQRLINYCEEALDAGIKAAIVDNTLGDISDAISSATAPSGMASVKRCMKNLIFIIGVHILPVMRRRS
jgi:methionyl aminopeptidase